MISYVLTDSIFTRLSHNGLYTYIPDFSGFRSHSEFSRPCGFVAQFSGTRSFTRPQAPRLRHNGSQVSPCPLQIWASLHISLSGNLILASDYGLEKCREDFPNFMKLRHQTVKIWLTRSGACPLSISISCPLAMLRGVTTQPWGISIT